MIISKVNGYYCIGIILSVPVFTIYKLIWLLPLFEAITIDITVIKTNYMHFCFCLGGVSEREREMAGEDVF